MMKRADILDTAKAYVTGDREEQHGNLGDNFVRISQMWGAYLNVNISAHDVGAMMALLKIARIKHNPTSADNWVDGAGYLACGGEMGVDE